MIKKKIGKKKIGFIINIFAFRFLYKIVCFKLVSYWNDEISVPVAFFFSKLR